jgi:pyruvate-formate lyase-activating enzyme
MPDFNTLEPAPTPVSKPSFLIGWEITMKCNLDCSYCGTDLYGGHNNKTPHPKLEESLKTIDFMYEYVDQYMQHKSKWSKQVVLDVYGGEALFYPGIDVVLEQIKEKYVSYKDKWDLRVTSTSNLIVGKNLFEKIYDYVDEYTASFHSESTEKQQEMFRQNLLFLKEKNKAVKVVVLMHPKEGYWEKCVEMINWCKKENIRFSPRQLDHSPLAVEYNYTTDQLEWFKNFWAEKSFGNVSHDVEIPKDAAGNHDLSQHGRACCGGRQLCTNQNYKDRTYYIHGNHFEGWSCSVNWFFMYIKQLTGEVFATSKDCKMNFDKSIGPIGYLKNKEKIISELKNQFATNTLPIITCAKKKCHCGLCAPKAKTKEDLIKIWKLYGDDKVFKTATSSLSI